MQKLAWKALTTGSAIGAAVLTRKLTALVWGMFSDKDAPLDPSDRKVPWRDALAWGVAAGVGAGVARVLGRRAATEAWVRATGEDPPGIDTA